MRDDKNNKEFIKSGDCEIFEGENCLVKIHKKIIEKANINISLILKRLYYIKFLNAWYQKLINVYMKIKCKHLCPIM